MPNVREAQRFLDILFGGVIGTAVGGKPLQCNIWSTPSKGSSFQLKTTTAARKAIELSKKNEDVYVGMGLTANPPKRGRGTINSIDAINFLWCDIDFEHEKAHKPKTGGKVLPPSEKDARKLLDEIPAAASMVIHSGHGLQAYWVFKEPMIFESKKERGEAAQLTQRWMATIQEVAKKHGWTVDAVHDLTRVLRCAGTMNLKAEPVPVKILTPKKGTEVTWHNPEDLAQFMVEETPDAEPSKAAIKAVHIQRPDDAGAIPPVIGVFCMNDSSFRRTWERKRTELPDQSASGYDLSLACQLAAAGCDDQTIADAIYAWRQMHGEDRKKAERLDYLARTIAKAREQHTSDVAFDKVAAYQNEQGTKEKKKPTEKVPVTPQTKEEMLTDISKGLDLDIAKVTQLGKEDPTYSIQLKNGTDIPIGDTRKLLSYAEVKVAIFKIIQKALRQIKKPQWERIAEKIARCAEVVEKPLLAEDTLQWVRSYIEVSRTWKEDKWTSALVNNDPFFKNGYVHIHLDAFTSHVYQTTHERITRNEVQERIRMATFKALEVNGRAEGKRRKRWYWRAFESVLDQHDATDTKGGEHATQD